MTVIIILTILLFLFGLYFYCKYNDSHFKEGLENKDKISCPNLLIQKNSKFYLYDTRLIKVPGVNPIQFNNLEEYTEFIDWQRSQGINCPVLYLQRSYDIQGKSCYKLRPSAHEPQGGLQPSSITQPHISSTANNTIHANQSNEKSENMLYSNDVNKKPSPNAMDPNWGGPEYTKKLVEEGYYKGDNVEIYVA
jgi:hypothetical protein